MESEKEIILMAAQGDRDAFGILVKQYSKRLYGFVYSILKNEHDSLDIVQDTFLKAFVSVKKFDMNKNFVTWLFTIAKNNSFNLIKSKEYNNIELADENINNNYNSTEDKVLMNVESKKLIDTIDKLPEKYRVIIYLKYISGFSYKEIGSRLHIKENLVESRIYTARKKIIFLMNEGE